METVQHVSPGMPTQAQLSYAPRPPLQYSLTNPAALPLGGGGSFKVSSAQSTAIPYSSYPGSSDLSSRYVQQSSQYNSSSDRPSSNSTSGYSETNHSLPLIGRSDRNNSSNNPLVDYMPPKSRAVLNSEHRSTHPINRINSTESYSDNSLSAAYHVDHGAPPNKRIKYNEVVKPELQQPLRVDTSERTVYNPPVEAISPTLPPAPPPPPPAPPPTAATLLRNAAANSPETSVDVNDKQDEAVINLDSNNFSNNPSELVDLLTKIEDEIRKTDQQLQQLKKKQKEMEENSTISAAEKMEPESEEIVLPKFIQVAKRIYDENWEKARASHQFFVKFGPLEDLPVYNQAPDTEIYHENKKKYTVIRPFLIDKIRKEKQAKEARDQNIAVTYNKMSTEWKRKLEKIENSQKRKARDLKNREVFEKVFPELRKQREDKERFSRSGGRVRSEADLEEIMDGLQEQELEDKKMRSYAVIPPLMLDSKQRRYSFINNNGLIVDLPKVAKENEFYNIWTESEKEIFKEKFLQHPKNFGVIASYLEKKTVCECVAYYYLSKKTEHYKRLLRKSRRTRTRNLHSKASGASAGGLANPGDLLYNNTPGVTTRLQREQFQQQQRLEQPQNLSVVVTTTASTVTTTSSSTSGVAATSSTAAATTTTTTAVATSTTVTDITPMETNAESSVEISTTTFLNGTETTPATPPTSSANTETTLPPGEKTETKSAEIVTSNDAENAAKPAVPDTVLDGRSAVSPVSPATNAVSNDGVKNETKPDIKKKERRKEDKKKNDTNTQIGDTSEEESSLPSEGNDKGQATHPCLVCKTDSTSSRALPRSHAQQYGLREDEVTPGARVCNLCRCKAVRSRYMHCPLPTCPNTKGNRVKRLRPLPCKWTDLPQHIKQPVITEFQIPSTATKCCSACFNRIQRRLVQMGVVATQGDDTSTSPTSSSQLMKWTDEETEALKRGISEHGTKWSEVSQVVGPSKSQYQCKTFYFNYRKKLGLDIALQEYNKKHFGEERKPTLSTDEEESGSTTSSCDELDRSVPDDSDTASAPSPAMNDSSDMNSTSNAQIDSSVNSEGMGSAVITKTPMMPDLPMDGSAMNTTATAISNLPGSTSPHKCTPPVISNLIGKEDYDSSATETADEGVGGGAENDNTSSSADHGKSNAGNGSEQEIAMVDVMSELIEYQLSKPASQSSSLTHGSSSISSIVDQNLIECDLRQQKARENSLATLSVVSATPHHQAHNDVIKDGVVYLQIPSSKEPPRDHETGTLDLSMKKPRSPEFVNNHMVHSTQSMHPSAVGKSSNSHAHTPLMPVPPHQPHVYKHPPAHEAPNSSYYHPQLVEVGRVTKTGEPLYSWKMQPPPIVMPQHPLITVKQQPHHPKLLNKGSSPQQFNQNIKLSPKQSPNGVSSSAGLNISLNPQTKISGSIMQGTPVSSANLYPTNTRDGRYDASLLRQITPPSHPSGSLVKESGSITQGTPVHQRSSSHSNSSAEYYPQPNSKRGGTIPATTFYPSRPPSYNDEQRHQIIMTDFVTSQHLCNIKDQREKNPYYYPARQGVIQRHNTNTGGATMNKSVSPHPYPPPGHEALSSLVDVAVRQPSLPVPLSHSGSTPNISQHKEDKQRLIIQEGLGDRFGRDAMAKERYIPREHREPERYARESQLHHPQSLHHEPPSIREHPLSHQLRENHLQREREREQYRQQEIRDQQMQHHYREQQQLQQKLREQERMRDQGKHRDLLPQMPPSMRDNHLQQQQQQQQHMHQAQQREVESHQYQRSSSANSRLAPEPPPPHARIQQIPTSIYQPHRVQSTSEQAVDNRIMQAQISTSTINYHREPAPVPVKSESGRESARPMNRQGDSSTVTAASLIDAIITHQINQTNDPAVSATTSQANSSAHVPSQRPGDKLFQVFPDPDGKLSPMKGPPTLQSRASPDVKSQPPQLQPQQPPPSHSLPVSSASDHSDSNSSRSDSNRGVPPTPPTSQSHVYFEQHAWKLRRALQQKELEQQDRNIVRIAGTQRASSPREKLGLQGCPFDYVKNKIVEVMHRTSDDDGNKSSGNSNHGGGDRSEDSNGEQSNQSSYIPATNYTYPYSALNINSQVPVPAHTRDITPAAPPKPVDVTEPTPILSSQYEPLSDDD